MAYIVGLPPHLSNLHDVFHVSQLQKYVSDPSHVIPRDDVQVRDNLTVETLPVRIEGREVKKLRDKEIPLVKVVWGGATRIKTKRKNYKMKNQKLSILQKEMSGNPKHTHTRIVFHNIIHYTTTKIHQTKSLPKSPKISTHNNLHFLTHTRLSHFYSICLSTSLFPLTNRFIVSLTSTSTSTSLFPPSYNKPMSYSYF